MDGPVHAFLGSQMTRVGIWVLAFYNGLLDHRTFSLYVIRLYISLLIIFPVSCRC